MADARKAKLGRAEALRLARAADHLYIVKGKSVLHIDLAKDKPADDDLAAALLGPTGNLRAPTIRQRKNLLIGFNEELFAEHLK
jgi:arsenate reductase-like glutaredoxin family protein